MTFPEWPDGCVVVSIEGIDGAGKSTLVRCLVDRLDIDEPDMHVFSTREFSGPIGLALESSLSELPPLARAYAFAAERHSVIDQITQDRPDLVLWDRYVDSSVASRHADAMLGTHDAELLLAVAQDIARLLPKPHLTLLLDVDPDTARTRTSAREARAQLSPYRTDGLRFLREGFIKCANSDPDRFVRIDAGLSPGQVCGEAMICVRTVVSQAKRMR